MTAPTEAPTVSIHDFTMTVDTKKSGDDKLVCRLDRPGESITMETSAAQLLWVIEDAQLFASWYAHATAQREAAPEPATAG